VPKSRGSVWTKSTRGIPSRISSAHGSSTTSRSSISSTRGVPQARLDGTRFSPEHLSASGLPRPPAKVSPSAMQCHLLRNAGLGPYRSNNSAISSRFSRAATNKGVSVPPMLAGRCNKSPEPRRQPRAAMRTPCRLTVRPARQFDVLRRGGVQRLRHRCSPTARAPKKRRQPRRSQRPPAARRPRFAPRSA
jgi:hypothetical protein